VIGSFLDQFQSVLKKAYIFLLIDLVVCAISLCPTLKIGTAECASWMIMQDFGINCSPKCLLVTYCCSSWHGALLASVRSFLQCESSVDLAVKHTTSRSVFFMKR
jgi:hypothetical protein